MTTEGVAMTKIKQHIEPKPSNWLERIVTGGCHVNDALNRRRFLRVAVVGALGAQGVAAQGDDQRVVTPKEIDDLLVNPGMGFATARSFNGDTMRQMVLGTRQAVPDDYPHCSLAEFKLFWGALEPKEGVYNFGLLVDLLKTARERGQDLSLRFMPWFPMIEDSAPRWFQLKAKRSFRCKFRRWSGPNKGLTEQDYWAPDFNDPFFLDRQDALIAAFAERYNGHPDLASLDIGSVGNWGEWHTSNTVPAVPMPTERNAQQVIDWYFRHWNKTPLVANFQDAAAFHYATAKGAGWRCDGVDAEAIQRRVDRLLGEGSARDAWQRGPVTGEPVEQLTRNPQRTLAKLLQWHASSLNWKSQPIGEAKPFVDDFLKRCGYRLVLRSLRFPRSVARGAGLPVRMSWENIGVAPPYRAHVLAVRLKGAAKPVVLDTDAKLTAWLPGKHDVDVRLPLPKDLPAGDYELAVGVLDPHYREPKVKLAIEGRGADGWYALGRVGVRQDS